MALLVGLLSGCGDEAFSSAQDYETIITVQAEDDSYDYSAHSTYYMPNVVVDLAQAGATPLNLEHPYDAEILAAVEDQMADRGFVRLAGEADTETNTDTDTNPNGMEPDTEAPAAPEEVDADIYVSVALVAETTWNYQGTYPFHPLEDAQVNYPQPEVPVSYSADSVIITIVDTAITHGASVRRYVPIWTAGVHATLTYSNADTLEAGIEQAFEQSPYLEAGGAK